MPLIQMSVSRTRPVGVCGLLGLTQMIASKTKIGITGVCGKLVKRHPICSTVPRFLESQRTYL